MFPHNVCMSLILILLITQSRAERDEEEDTAKDEQGFASTNQHYKLGEFNDRCKTNRDCRPFGYVCRDNKTCQCDFMYIPNADKKKCVGGVNQRCVYDEHCIDGAFCMNQAVCRCKDSSPVELEDGLICSDGCASVKFINYQIFLLFSFWIL